jgi:hypothetical protein
VFVVVLQVSAVHTLVSTQSEFDMQQPAVSVLAQTPVAVLQLSVVQVLLSLQSALAVQQPVAAVCTHRCVVVLQLSFVHPLLSSQSALAVQQFVIAVLTQLFVVRLHVSKVQMSLSLQSEGLLQQFAIAVFTHCPGLVVVSQLSVVHAFPSLHWALVVQFSAWATRPVGTGCWSLPQPTGRARPTSNQLQPGERLIFPTPLLGGPPPAPEGRSVRIHSGVECRDGVGAAQVITF